MGKSKRKSGNMGRSMSNSSLGEFKPTPKPIQDSTEHATKPRMSAASSLGLEVLGIAVSFMVLFWHLTSRIDGVLVSVLNDEYTYLVDTLPDGPNKTGLPNYLFHFVYKATLTCGTEFYSCARSLNAAFVLVSGLFIYLLARYISKKIWIAAVAGFATILGSLGTYSAYFMPEAIFNIFMVAFFWALIRFGASSSLIPYLAMGIIIGIAAVAKPHAFFVLPAILLFVFLWTWSTKANSLVLSMLRIATLSSVMVVTKLGLGFLIVGEAGLTLFGGYGAAISSGEAVANTLGGNTWEGVPYSAWGQILMTTMILGLSLSVSLVSLISSLKRDPEAFESNRFRVLFALCLLNMMSVSAIFESWQDIGHWMHTRYHSYLIPLGIIVFVEAYKNRASIQPKSVKLAVVGLFVVLSVIALVTAAVPYGANWIDAPDFKTHIDLPVFSSVSLIVGMILAIWWIWDSKLPMIAGLIATLLTSIISGVHITAFLQTSFGSETVHDQLGRILRNYLPEEELDKAVLVGDNWVNLDRALFMAVNGNATKISAPEGSFDINQIDGDARWLIRVGNVEVNGLGEPTIVGQDYSFYSLSEQNSLRPKFDSGSSYEAKCTNSDDAMWLCGNEAVVSFNESSSKNTRVDFIVEFSEEASKVELEFILGDSTLRGTPPPGPYALTLPFSNSQGTDKLIIRNPNQSFGNDTRLLRVISVVVND
jgi:phosphoglycerol transferase